MSNYKIKPFDEIEQGDTGLFQTTVGRGITLKSNVLTCTEKFLSLLKFEDSEGLTVSLDYIAYDTLASNFMVEDRLPNVPGTFIQIDMAVPSSSVLDMDLPESLPVIAVLTDKGSWRTASRGRVTALLPEEITEWSHVNIEVRS